MKQELYKLENQIEKVKRGEPSNFLDEKQLNLFLSRIGKNKYKVYSPYKDSERKIIYMEKLPSITLYKIKTKEELKHQEIMGSILSLNIDNSYLGDIIKKDNNWYFYILSIISPYIKENLTYIGRKKIELEDIDLEILSDYKREYDELELIVSSLRIDTVVSSIINKNRKDIINLLKNKEVMINYEEIIKPSYLLKEGDIFSIRRYGKYKYIGIIKNTRKDHFVISILKYK